MPETNYGYENETNQLPMRRRIFIFIAQGSKVGAAIQTITLAEIERVRITVLPSVASAPLKGYAR